MLGVPLAAQTDAHWGIQGDYYAGTVPSQIVEHIKDLVEKPDIDAKSYNTGLVRFHADGSPNWAVEFTNTHLTIFGSRAFASATVIGGIGAAEVHGSGNIRGAMASKYVTFFSRTHVSAGLELGGGVAQLEASYTHSYTGLNAAILAPVQNYSYTVPTFQALALVDIRPVRWVSLSPFYGVRNGTYGFGGALRIHFTR